MYRNFIDYPIQPVKTLADQSLAENEEKKNIVPAEGFLKRNKKALIGAAVIAAAAFLLMPKGTIKKYLSLGNK